MRARSRLASLLALLLVVSSSRALYADDVADEADLQFQLGAERYQAGDYRGALEHFLASNRLVANRNVLFNIARAYEQLKQFPDAFRYYVKALTGEADAATRARIEDALKRISPHVAVLRVETDPPGARVYLDRKDLGDRGTAPQRFGLPPGKYKVIAELPGYEDAESQPVEVRIGGEQTVSLKLTRIVGTVRVEGEAKGATVRADSEASPPLGTVPCDVQLPPGRHILLITQQGFQTAQVPVDVRAKDTVIVRPQITAMTGTLVVDADERDALIELDGRPVGFTPSVLTVPVGAHRVKVALKGFRPVERNVDIAVGGQAKINVELISSEQVEAASRTAESVEDAPSSVSIIPSLELRAMSYPNVAEAVRGTRGVFVTDDRGYQSLGVRGFGRPGDYGNRVLVLLDGQPMNDNWIWSSYVGYDLRTDLEDIDRIEVVRGPGSVLYGTSAFSGVINLKTRGRDAPDSMELGASTSDYGMARARARVTHHFTKDAGVWTSFAAGHASGREFFFREYVADGPPGVAGNARNVDGLDVATFTGGAWYKALSLQWSFHLHRKHLPAGEFNTVLGDEGTRQTDSRAMVEARFEPRITESLQSLSRAHFNYYGYRGHFVHLPDAGGLEYDTYDGTWVGVEQRFLYSPVKSVRVTVGGELQDHLQAHQFAQNETLAPQGVAPFLDDSRKFQTGAAYALADVSPTERVKVSAGARLDSYSTFGSSVNPRLAVIFKPYDRGNVKVMAGKAFRAPSVYELFYNVPGQQVAAPNISPEDIYSGEVEYSHRFTSTLVGVVSAYANVINNLIALRATDAAGTTYQYQNTKDPVGTAGVEVEARREWKEGWMLAASGSFNHTQYLKSSRFGDLVSFAPNPNLREVPNAPLYLASLKGAAPILQRALVAMTRVTLTGPRYDRNDALDAPPQQRTDPAVIWDLVFSGTELRWGVRYSLGVYNLFDWRWYAPVSNEFRQDLLVQSGRTLLATGSVTF